MFRHIALSLIIPGLLIAAEPVPTMPLIATAPTPSGWKVNVTYKLSQPEPADKGSAEHASWAQLQEIVPAIKEIRVGKTSQYRREIIYYAQGKQDERVVAGKREFLRKAAFAPGDVYVADAPTTSDFPEINWVTLQNYVGIQNQNGRQCFYFSVNTPGNAPLQAWIDTITRLPVRLDDGMHDRHYEFFAAPAVPMEPSAEIAKKLREIFGNRAS